MVKQTLKELFTGLLLFSSIGVLYFGAAKAETVKAAAGVSEALMEIVEETESWSYVGTLYSSTTLNVRTEPNTECDIVCQLIEYEPIEVWGSEYYDDWYKTKSGYYIWKDYLIASEDVPSSTYYGDIYCEFKSWTHYCALTAVDSPQWALQQRAYTGNYGLRMVENRYCVALGSRFTTQIGQKFDIILGNGTVIPCVLCDQKSNRHTDSTNTYTVVTGSKCATEFYVGNGLYSAAKSSGDISSIPGWNSPVVGIRVYNSFV